MTLCVKHPRYLGKNKPTTKLTEADGCTCVAEFARIKAEREVLYTYETHSSFTAYDGKPSRTNKIKLETNDIQEVLKKIFKSEQPGIGQILKVYRHEGEDRVFIGNVFAQLTVISRPSGTSVKSSARDYIINRKESLSPLEIHRV